MPQPVVLHKMPFSSYIADVKVQEDRAAKYHVIDGNVHYGYDFADAAAALAYHQGLPNYISTTIVDANNAIIVRATDAAYLAGVTGGLPAALVTFDAFHSGSGVILTANGLHANVTTGQKAARVNLGRDPAAGGIWEWEIDAIGSPATTRPAFGVVRSDAADDQAAVAFNTALAWMFGCGSSGFENDYMWHNGLTGGQWSALGGGSGGLGYTYTMKLDMLAQTFTIRRNGVAQLLSFGGVTAPAGVLLHPYFSSGSGGAGNQENGTLRVTGLTYPSAGATPWLGR